jgi:hypothetical protein
MKISTLNLLLDGGKFPDTLVMCKWGLVAVKKAALCDGRTMNTKITWYCTCMYACVHLYIILRGERSRGDISSMFIHVCSEGRIQGEHRGPACMCPPSPPVPNIILCNIIAHLCNHNSRWCLLANLADWGSNTSDPGHHGEVQLEFLVCNYQLQLWPRQGSIQHWEGLPPQTSNCSACKLQ